MKFLYAFCVWGYFYAQCAVIISFYVVLFVSDLYDGDEIPLISFRNTANFDFVLLAEDFNYL